MTMFHECFGLPGVSRQKRDLLDLFGWGNRASVQQPLAHDLEHDGFQPCAPKEELTADFETHHSCCPYKYLFLGMLLQSLLSDRRGREEPPKRKFSKKKTSPKIGIITENTTELVIFSDEMPILADELHKLVTSTIRLAKEGMVDIASTVPKSLKILYFGDEATAEHIGEEKLSTGLLVDFTESSTASHGINSSIHADRHIKDDSGFRRFFKVGSYNTNKLSTLPTILESSSKVVYLPEDLPVPDDFYDISSEVTLLVTSAKPINLMKGFFSHWMTFNKQHNDTCDAVNSTRHPTVFPISQMKESNGIYFTPNPQFSTVNCTSHDDLVLKRETSTNSWNFVVNEYDDDANQSNLVFENATYKLLPLTAISETVSDIEDSKNTKFTVNSNLSKSLNNDVCHGLLNATTNGMHNEELFISHEKYTESIPRATTESIKCNFENSSFSNKIDIMNNQVSSSTSGMKLEFSNEMRNERLFNASSPNLLYNPPSKQGNNFNIYNSSEEILGGPSCTLENSNVNYESQRQCNLTTIFKLASTKESHENCSLIDKNQQQSVPKALTQSSLIKSIVELMGFHDKATTEITNNAVENVQKLRNPVECMLVRTPISNNTYSNTMKNLFQENYNNQHLNLLPSTQFSNNNFRRKFRNKHGPGKNTTSVISPTKAVFKNTNFVKQHCSTNKLFADNSKPVKITRISDPRFCNTQPSQIKFNESNDKLLYVSTHTNPEMDNKIISFHTKSPCPPLVHDIPDRSNVLVTSKNYTYQWRKAYISKG